MSRGFYILLVSVEKTVETKNVCYTTPKLAMTGLEYFMPLLTNKALGLDGTLAFLYHNDLSSGI